MLKNEKMEGHLYNGQSIMISGIDSVGYPKTLIKAIKDSGVNNLTLIYVKNNDHLDPEGDPMDLIYNGQVTKLITSHLGEMGKTFSQYLDEVELLPTDILMFKIQAGANGLPGLTIDYEYAKLYRDREFLKAHTFESEGHKYVFEPALTADISIIAVDNLDIESFNCSFDGTAYTSLEVAKASNMCFAECNTVKPIHFDDVDILGQYIEGYVESPNGVSFQKTNNFE